MMAVSHAAVHDRLLTALPSSLLAEPKVSKAPSMNHRGFTLVSVERRTHWTVHISRPATLWLPHEVSAPTSREALEKARKCIDELIGWGASTRTRALTRRIDV
jgi:hypothetical protein